jgi:prepilin-type N-terminal cleavage/methylation domain-containing protein
MRQVRGFSLTELLVAMTITLLLAGALAGIIRPARDAFDRVPAEIAVQQRGRIAIDSIAQAVRSAARFAGAVAVSEPDESGVSTELTAIVPLANGAQGIVDLDQAGPASPITLAVAQCPNVKDVCGFTAGATAVIADAAGMFDVFTIASTDAGARRLTPSGALSQAYATGSVIVEVDQFTFSLADQTDGSYSLIRTTAAGAVQPIVDVVDGLSFELVDDQVVVSLEIGGRMFTASINARNAP